MGIESLETAARGNPEAQRGYRWMITSFILALAGSVGIGLGMVIPPLFPFLIVGAVVCLVGLIMLPFAGAYVARRTGQGRLASVGIGVRLVAGTVRKILCSLP